MLSQNLETVTMNAETAKKLTQSNLKGPVIKPYLDYIYQKIESAAKEGRDSVSHPFHGIRGTWPSSAAQEAIWQELRSNGYKVRHVPNPDPGHPASSDYDEISWS